MKKKKISLLSDEKGSVSMEYAILVGLLAMGMIFFAAAVGNGVASIFVNTRIAISESMGKIVIIQADERNPNGKRDQTGR